MFSVNEILKAIKGKLLSGSMASRVEGVSIDSRTARQGQVFIAIKGKRRDGHAFIADAFKKGTRGAIVCSKHILSADVKRSLKGSDRFIVSATDTLKALGKVALLHRRRFDIPVSGYGLQRQDDHKRDDRKHTSE